MEEMEVLKRAIAIPSVSAKKMGIGDMVHYMQYLLKEIGMKVFVFQPEGGHPFVFGMLEGEGKKRLLIYNHYDVQPEEPVELWESPPYELTEREGKWYGRGVADNKGNIIARWIALKQAKEEGLPLPTILWLIEGEEEIGSPHIEEALHQWEDLLKADGCLWESGGVNWEGRPVLTLGCKGILYLQLACKSLSRDVHSSMSAILPSAVWRLIWALKELKNEREEILIPKFYEDVHPPTNEELRLLDELPLEEEKMKEIFGVTEFLCGLTGIELKKRLFFSPSLNICGIWGGYSGEGGKTVLPAEARCKIDFRLVPDQDPKKIREALREFLDARGFSDVVLEEYEQGEKPARTPVSEPFVQFFRRCVEEAYGKKPVIEPLMAGTGPMAPFRELLNVPIVGFGVGYPDTRAHSPNENIRISDFHSHIHFLKHFFAEFSAW
ncbi:MAG: M20/M25/M40 family metallo-hydrolase [bacterium JZ-2024 1]